MSQAIFVQRGETIDYTAAGAVNAGAVIVLGDLVGVANRAIPANTLGSLMVEGVFDFVKATGAGTALAVGTIVYWDVANNRVTSVATGNKLLGKVVMAASDSDPRVRVRMSQ